MTRKSKLYFLKKEIEKSPLIGAKDLDGAYFYKKNGYTLRYRIIKLPSGEKKIRLISYKSRLSGLEEFIYKIKRFFQRIIFYSHIKHFLVISFFLIITIIYIWILIPESKKEGFYKFALSHAIGVSPEQVEYRGGGWFEIYGKRIISTDKRSEPLTFEVNPLRWLSFSDFGSVTRWRGKESGGYKTYDLKTDKEGKISTEETGREIFGGKVKLPDIEGKAEGNKIEWGTSEGAGPFSQDIEATKEGIRVIDR